MCCDHNNLMQSHNISRCFFLGVSNVLSIEGLYCVENMQLINVKHVGTCPHEKKKGGRVFCDESQLELTGFIAPTNHCLISSLAAR